MTKAMQAEASNHLKFYLVHLITSDLTSLYLIFRPWYQLSSSTLPDKDSTQLLIGSAAQLWPTAQAAPLPQLPCYTHPTSWEVFWWALWMYGVSVTVLYFISQKGVLDYLKIMQFINFLNNKALSWAIAVCSQSGASQNPSEQFIQLFQQIFFYHFPKGKRVGECFFLLKQRRKV